MKATTEKKEPFQTFTLELSFIEMHVIMQAMSNYAHRTGYGQWGHPPNEAHAAAAEKLHDELTEIYTA